MTEARLIRRVRFQAEHHYARSDWSEAENRRVFGPQVDAHGHEWMAEIHIVGPMDEATGFVTDLAALDDALAALMAGWDGGDLNLIVPEVADGTMQPSTESLARWLYRRLEHLIVPPARLAEVGLFESPELGARYPSGAPRGL